MAKKFSSCLTFLHLLIPGLAGMLLTGCMAFNQGAGVQAEYIPYEMTGRPSARPADSFSYWDGEGIHGPPKIEIHLRKQRAYFYKGDRLVGVSLVSTGREGMDTPTGTFKVQEKDIDHASSLYGDYVDEQGNVVRANVDSRVDPKPPGTRFKGTPMPYFMRVHNAIGMHEGYLPGYPASHGCIRLPGGLATEFYHHAEVGTPVEIIKG